MPKHDKVKKATVTHIIRHGNSSKVSSLSNAKVGDDVVTDYGNFKKGAKIFGKIVEIRTEKL